jgi:signal transduction histidine kinase
LNWGLQTVSIAKVRLTAGGHVAPDRSSEHLLDSYLDIVSQMASGTDTVHVLASIVDTAMRVTGARYGAVGTLDPEGGFVDFIYRGLTPEEVALLPHLPEGKGLFAAVTEGRTIRTDYISRHPSSIGFPIDHVAMHAFIGVPLITLGKVVGGLFVTKGPGEQPFTEGDENSLKVMASLAAVAIQNTQLTEAESDRVERGHLLQKIASRVRRSLDIAEVCTATVEILGSAANADRCFIRLMVPGAADPHLGEVKFEWVAPGVRPLPKHPALKLAVSELTHVTRSTQWTEDATSDENLNRGDILGSSDDYRSIGVRAALSTPLEWGDEFMGVIGFHSIKPHRWSPAEIALIEAGAREVAVGLHHAHLYSAAVDTAEKLRQVDQMRSDFVSMVSHELRSPMTVVAGIADVLEKRHDRLKSDQRTELIETLGREARRLRRLVSEILDLEALDQGGMSLELTQVDLSEIVREAVADSGERGRIRTVVEPGDTTVQGDHDRIKQVLLNLISNASKFSEDDASIDVQLKPENDKVSIAVTDHGPGISTDDQAQLFHKFSRLDASDTRKPGSGLGLYLSRAIIERHGGTIGVESEVGEGSTFSFSLPR